LYDANLHTVFSAMALRALALYQVDTPWLHQDTTTISFYGAYEEDEVGNKGPRPTYGYSQDGRGDLKQVILSLGVSGGGGIPLRMGLHDGDRSDTVDVPQAIEQSVALGLGAYAAWWPIPRPTRRAPWGLCRETGMGLVTLVPRTCAIRQEVEQWGQQQTSLPRLLEKAGKRRVDALRRWYGRSVTRQVEVEDSQGQVTWAPMRFVAVYSTQLAQRHAEAHANQQQKEAKSLATPIAEVECRPFACQADAEGAIAAYEGRGPGRRGRVATPWRYHEVGYEVESRLQRQKRTQRGRPRKGEEPQEETVYQLKVTTQALAAPVATFG
jgi:transposase